MSDQWCWDFSAFITLIKPSTDLTKVLDHNVNYDEFASSVIDFDDGMMYIFGFARSSAQEQEQPHINGSCHHWIVWMAHTERNRVLFHFFTQKEGDGGVWLFFVP